MYISRIKLDPHKRETSVALRDRSFLHTAVENSVAGERPHNMWRLEPDMSLVIVSKEMPYLKDIQEQYGTLCEGPEIKEYDGYIDRIKKGDILWFKIEVNPVINIKNGSKNGKDVPLNLIKTAKHPYCAEDWIKEKLEERGAGILDIHSISHDTLCFTKKGKRIPLFSVTYNGLIKVMDEEGIKNALRNGIGGKKTYGCGMLTVIPTGES